MFLGRMNQYCENDYNTQIQCDPYQITNGIFHRIRKKKFTIHMETRPWIANTVFRKKNGAGGINLPDQIILQSYSHQDSMVLAQKLKYRPMKQDREPRNKPMHLSVPCFWQRRQEYIIGQRQCLQYVLLGKLDMYK